MSAAGDDAARQRTWEMTCALVAAGEPIDKDTLAEAEAFVAKFDELYAKACADRLNGTGELKLVKQPDYGTLYTLDEFRNHVESGLFTDDDGSGVYATPTRMSAQGRGRVNLSDITPPSEIFTHIRWFNK